MSETSKTGTNLVIVESPAKAKTIEKFLGEDFHVVSCFGHIRDLIKKNSGIIKENNYAPQYEVSTDKKKIVADLKTQVKKASVIWLASDEDREGEAIAWHLAEELGLKPEKTRRIVFDEITRDAIQHAVKNPRSIDQNLVNAQQARRILDRLVGFELSPILWRKVRPSLSAGRVQSVAVRLIVEREREIQDFKASASYRVGGLFKVLDGGEKEVQFWAELTKRMLGQNKVAEFLEKCKGARFTVSDVVTKPAKKTPAPPFTTSTLQQEASRKLGFSVAQTMRVAQTLYEEGRITYMRTDSVHLSELALNSAKQEITRLYGPQYAHTRHYQTKTKGAQEAHEAIRPTYMNETQIPGTAQEKKLYELIWKRAVASQMSDALLEKTTVTIDISSTEEKFVAKGEVIRFDGFLKVYLESTDSEREEEGEEGGRAILPPIHVKDNLEAREIQAMERFTQRPARYTEASLVKKLEELGIGRPSTYAPTISTIQQREYVVKEDRPGTPRQFKVFTLVGAHITEETRTEIFGTEKSKLFPTDIGMVVNDFLVQHFDTIMAYNFTASVEKEFDEIAEGKLVWYKMIDSFYQPFHQKVLHTTETSERNTGTRLLGTDPKTEKPVYVRIGKFGPMAQLGESQPADADKSAPPVEKPKYAKLLKDQRIETITLEEALSLFRLPRSLGLLDGFEVTVAVGRFGPYVLHNGAFYSLKKDVDDPYTIQLERAEQLIAEKKEADKNKTIQVFTGEVELKILNGRFGPYISYEKENYKVPKNTDPTTLTLQDCLDIIQKTRENPKGKAPRASKTDKIGKARASKASTKTKKAQAEKSTTTKTKTSKTSKSKKAT